MMSRYCIPCISNKSLEMSCHGLIGTSWGFSGSRWLTGWFSWHNWHCLHNASMSLLIFIQTTLSQASWRVFSIPWCPSWSCWSTSSWRVWGWGCSFPCRWLQTRLQVRHGWTSRTADQFITPWWCLAIFVWSCPSRIAGQDHWWLLSSIFLVSQRESWWGARWGSLRRL